MGECESVARQVTVETDSRPSADAVTLEGPTQPSTVFHVAAGSPLLWEGGPWLFAFLLSLGHSIGLVRQLDSFGPDAVSYATSYESHNLDAFSLEYLWQGMVHLGWTFDLSFSQWLVGLLTLQCLVWCVFGYRVAIAMGLPRPMARAMLPLTLIAVFIYPFLVSGQTNILRAGLSVPLGALGALSLIKREWVPGIALLAAATLVHTPVGLIMICGALGMLLSRKAAVFVFIVCAGAYTLSIHFFAPSFLLDMVRDYGSSSEYITGVRYDFLLFSVFLLAVVALLTMNDPQRSVAARTGPWLVGLSVPFLLVGGSFAFADRYIQPMWALAPILIIVLVQRLLSPTWRSVVCIEAAIAAVIIVVFAL